MENVTVFDDLSAKAIQDITTMEIDNNTDKLESSTLPTNEASSLDTTPLQNNVDEATKEVLVSKPDVRTQNEESRVPDMDKLYPIFWRLQNFFSTPTKLFDASNLIAFKNGLETTLRKFKQVDKELESSGSSKNPDDNKRGTKRKRGGSGEDLAASFNPKYLTSRDLFELEVIGLSHRRNSTLDLIENRSAI